MGRYRSTIKEFSISAKTSFSGLRSSKPWRLWRDRWISYDASWNRTSRPIECLELKNWSDLSWTWSVQTLHLSLDDDNDDCIDLLPDVSGNVLPVLQVLIVSVCPDDGRDLSPLFLFAAKRLINQLTLTGYARDSLAVSYSCVIFDE